MSIKLISPAGTREEDVTYAFWWTLFLGPFYFGYHRIWDHAILSMLLGILTSGISVLIYPFFAEKIIMDHYLKSGWKIKE